MAKTSTEPADARGLPPRAAGSRRARTAGLLCAVLAATCGRDAEPASDDAPALDSLAGEAPSPPAAAETATPDDGGGGEEAPAGPEDTRPAGLLGRLQGNGFAEDLPPEPIRLIRIPAGTRINVVGGEDISTASHGFGDPVVATVIQDVRGPDGKRLLPQGVSLLGRVRTSIGSGGLGEDPVLEIAFETLSAYNYERPVEGVVVNAPVVLDPAAARARGAAPAREAAVTEVPGLIMKGTIIVVELRAPVHVPPFAAPARPVLRGDSARQEGPGARTDTIPARDPT